MGSTDTRRTAASRPEGEAIALPWYEPHEYASVRALMKDGASYLSSHRLWVKGARRAEQFFVSKGRATVRVYIHPSEFAQWCHLHGHELDTRGRLAYGRWSASRGRGAISSERGG
ncbi:MAG: hypothetical protein ACXWCU_07960 [Caldimonas sp.]